MTKIDIPEPVLILETATNRVMGEEARKHGFDDYTELWAVTIYAGTYEVMTCCYFDDENKQGSEIVINDELHVFAHDKTDAERMTLDKFGEKLSKVLGV